MKGLIDEQRNALEAHILLKNGANMDQVKTCLKTMLHDEFKIEHSSLEFENLACNQLL